MKMFNLIRDNRNHITRIILSVVVLLTGLWFLFGGVTPAAAEFLQEATVEPLLLFGTSVFAVVGGFLGILGTKFKWAAKWGLMLMFTALLYFAILSGVMHGPGTVRWITYSGFALLAANEFLRVGVSDDWYPGRLHGQQLTNGDE